MNVRLPIHLFALLALAQLLILLPAVADSGAPAEGKPVVLQHTPAALPACLGNAPGVNLVQLECCKGHKGICGCRAGKIVCCDNTASKEPGCACHGDDGIAD